MNSELKGYVVPDEYLRKMKGYDSLREMHRTNYVINNAVDSLRNSLFSYKKQKHFEIECADPDLRQLLNDTVLRQQFDGIYGQAYDLEGFLRMTLASLLVFGRCFYKIDWVEKDHNAHGKRWLIQRIRWLAVETMEVIRDNDQIHSFKQEYSDHCGNKSVRGTTFTFEKDEILFVEWIFDGDENKGVSPLKRLIQHSEEMGTAFEDMRLQVHAFSHPEDHSYKAERLRHTPWKEIRGELDQSRIKMQSSLGIIPNAPMTEYYETYQFVKFRKRIARIREFLLSEFNEQIVTNIAKRNKFRESARINLIGYMSEGEIQDLFDSYKKKEITGEKLREAFQDEII